MGNNVGQTLRTFSCPIDTFVKADSASVTLASIVFVAASSRAASSARLIIMIAAGVGIHGRSGRALLRGRCQLCSIGSQVLEQFDSEGNRIVWSISLTKSSDSFLGGTANPVP